jgi:2-methylaconitate cis-trans-isomerase PrpF
MGGATSSTSKTVILAKSMRRSRRRLPVRPGLHRQAVRRLERQLRQPVGGGRFVRHQRGLVDPARVPRNGVAVVRIWQANIGKTIIAHVPITDGAVQETGDFELDGVTFPAAEVQLEFIDPAAEEEGGGGSMFPTGNLVDDLEVPGVGTFKATMINAGIPTIFVNAADLGYTGTELQARSTATPRRWRCSRPSAPTARCAWA